MGMRIVTAVAALVSAYVHLKLWLDGMSDVDVVGPAFLLNAVAGLVIAVLLLAWRNWVPGFLAAGFGASTLGAFILSTTVGLFGVEGAVGRWLRLGCGHRRGRVHRGRPAPDARGVAEPPVGLRGPHDAEVAGTQHSCVPSDLSCFINNYSEGTQQLLRALRTSAFRLLRSTGAGQTGRVSTTRPSDGAHLDAGDVGASGRRGPGEPHRPARQRLPGGHLLDGAGAGAHEQPEAPGPPAVVAAVATAALA